MSTPDPTIPTPAHAAPEAQPHPPPYSAERAIFEMLCLKLCDCIAIEFSFTRKPFKARPDPDCYACSGRGIIASSPTSSR